MRTCRADGLLLLAGPMLATLFQSAVFDAYDVEMATRSLMAYSLGLQAFILIKVLAPGFYARQDTRTPVRMSPPADPAPRRRCSKGRRKCSW